MSRRPTLIRGRTLLAEIYGWFTDTSAGPVLRSPAEGGGLRSADTSAGPVLRSPAEGGGLRSARGFDTRDLREAKVVLDELSQGR